MTDKLPENYQEALDYIYSFVDFSRTHQENLRPENFDLGRMERFMGLLGHPQHDFPSLHIAGSKGKGSVSAFCASALEQADYKVGLYTSPHLKDFEERMQINRIPIPRTTLVDLVAEIHPAVAQVPGLTTFEIMTGLAFLYFAREEIQIGVIEVGLGGRLDATNVITPLVSVITSLYLDHITILGDTLDKIAREKGGIIKPGVPAVTAPQKSEALQVIRAIAAEQGSPLIEVEASYPYQMVSRDLDGQAFRIMAAKDEEPRELFIPLLGDYQVVNAVTAYAALDVLRKQGFPLQESQIRLGFADTRWPARFEILQRDPPVIVDSAHNPAAMEKLRETIDSYFPGQELILVFGISEDKQLDGMYEAILPRTAHLICTKADHPRAMDAEELAHRAGGFETSVEAVPEVAAALRRALDLVTGDRVVLVAGSIFVAASARIAWFEELDQGQALSR
jgi:dihydrofolate synthase/folylpolyglutamate synthase